MKVVSPLGAASHYRRRRLSEQKHIHYNSEYDRVTGELPQSSVPHSVTKIDSKEMIEQAYRHSQVAKASLFLQYIEMPDVRNKVQWS